jgi:hypothetical protein
VHHPLRRLIFGTVSAATAFLAFGQAALADNEGVGVYGGRVHFIVSAPSFYNDGTYDDGEDDGHCGC